MTYVEHGLMDMGDADPRQGQLFDPGTYEVPMEQLAAKHGVPMPRVQSLGGFLPGLDSTRKVQTALGNWSDARTSGGDPSPSLGSALRRNLANRSQSPDTTWYGGRDPEVEGDSVRMIRHAAEEKSTGVNEMTRAVAVTSPQMPWDAGTPLHRSYPNIDVAKNVATHMRKFLGGTERRSFSEEELGAVAQETPGQGLFKDRAAMSFLRGGETAQQIIPSRPGYGKVPNFNENLHASRQDLPKSLRRAYASGVTVDSHMLGASGMSEEAPKRAGVYDVEHMLHARAAFKNRELPMNHQAAVWTRQRGAESLTASADLGRGYYEPVHSLFYEDHHGHHTLHPSFNFDTGHHGPVDNRGKTARDLGLEF